MKLVELPARFIGALAVAGALVVGVPAAAHADTGYTLTELPNLPGATAAAVLGINDDGVATGWSQVGDRTFQAVRWDADGAITALPGFPGDTNSIAEAINPDGVIVGMSFTENAGSYRPVRWDPDGTVTDLGALPGSTEGTAYGINADGFIVGLSGRDGGHEPVRWNPDGTITKLEQPAGRYLWSASAIADNGDILGSWSSCCPLRGHTIRWTRDGTATELSGGTTLGPDGTIVGVAGTTGHLRMIRVSADGSAVEIPSTHPFRPRGINRDGVIAGQDEQSRVSFVRDESGTATALDVLPGQTCTAFRINGAGVIAGFCDTDGKDIRRPVMWTPQARR